MKKKSIVMLATGIVLAASLAIGGTLAYFTSQDDVNNVFTVGAGIKANIDESTVEADGNGNYTQATGRTEEGNTYEGVVPGSMLYKDPTITMDANSGAAYIRAKVAISNYAALKAQLGAADVSTLFSKTIGDGWTLTNQGTAAVVDDVVTYIVEYATPVDKDHQAPAIFTQVELPGTMNDLSGLNGKFEIKVTGEAIQAAGFNDAAAAFAALDAEPAPAA